MIRKFYQENRTELNKFDAILLNNPILERGLVIAPIIVAANSLKNAIALGIAFTVITFFTITVSYFIPKNLPYTFRVIGNALIASLIFVPAAILVERVIPASVQSLGIYLPLLTTNSLIIQKSESRFHKMEFLQMLLRIFCNCIGFFLVALALGFIRELFGNGSIMGTPISGFTLKIPAFLFPFMGFILIGFLAASVKKLVFFLNSKPKIRRKRKNILVKLWKEASKEVSEGDSDE